MSATVVIGMQWGDEAKGKVVDYVSQDADYVVRFNGGNNAGHTVVVDGEVFKFHTLPVGALNPGVTSVIADGVVIDPEVLVGELDELASRGHGDINLRISSNAHVIMPYHKLLDRLEEERKADKKIGTTGRGIGPCYADKASRIGIRMAEFVDPVRFGRRLDDVLGFKNIIIEKIYGAKPLALQEVYADYWAYSVKLARYVDDTNFIVHEAAKEGKKIVFEGAHGSLLDIDHGTYPYVSSSHAVAGGACIGTGIGPMMIDRVIGVAKSYTTRVGGGWFPTEQDNEIGEKIRARGKEYGTTTGRPRRCGWFDAMVVRHAARVSSVSGLALMSLDVLTGLDEVRIGYNYFRPSKWCSSVFPRDPAQLEDCQVGYHEFPGWKSDISKVRKFEDLPVNAQRYIQSISKEVGVPIVLISVGPGRDQTIVVEPKLLR